MRTAIRRVAAFGVVLLACGVAAAQPALAPAPHPPLDEVVREYRRLGLPLPPPNAELVRVDWWQQSNPEERPHDSYILVFRTVPPKPGSEPKYFVGWRRWTPAVYVDPDWIEVPQPVPGALHRVSLASDEFLALAVHCKLRGWDTLAAAAYARAREVTAASWEPAPVLVQLRQAAWWHWEGQLTERTSDRKEILRRLKALAEEDEGLRDPRNGWLLSALETTVFAGKAKPGTIEARIDDLTEYWVDQDDWPNKAGQESYWKLVELGFDAVPVLIDHLNDDRLSRAMSRWEGGNFRPYHLTVGHLCSRLLYDLSAGKIGGHYWELRGDRLNPDKAREWFAAAQKFGEERWLLSHAVPGAGGVNADRERPPEPLITRVIGARYPGRLAELYRTILRNHPRGSTEVYVAAIVAAKLTREQKVALLEEGALHEDIGRRCDALEGLAGLDRGAFRKHLLLTLKQTRARLDQGNQWIADPFSLVRLVESAEDPACWAALAAVAHAAYGAWKESVVWAVGRGARPGRDDPNRRERIRFLVGFLDDRTTEFDRGDIPGSVEVRDEAASQLAGMLRFPVKRNSEAWVMHDPERGPFAALGFRLIVWRAAEGELAAKPPAPPPGRK